MLEIRSIGQAVSKIIIQIHTDRQIDRGKNLYLPAYVGGKKR